MFHCAFHCAFYCVSQRRARFTASHSVARISLSVCCELGWRGSNNVRKAFGCVECMPPAPPCGNVGQYTLLLWQWSVFSVFSARPCQQCQPLVCLGWFALRLVIVVRLDSLLLLGRERRRFGWLQCFESCAKLCGASASLSTLWDPLLCWTRSCTGCVLSSLSQ